MSVATCTATVLFWWGALGFSTDHPIQAFAVAADGQRIVCARDGNWFDVLDPYGNPVASGRASDGDQLRVMAFSPDGHTLAGGIAESCTVWLWDARTGEQHLSLNANPNGVQSLAFSPSGRWLACGGADDGSVLVMDPIRRDAVAAVGIHVEGEGVRVTTVSFHPSGRWFVAGGTATRRRLPPILSRVSDLDLAVRDLSDWPETATGIVRFRPDGRVVYAATAKGVWALETTTGQWRWRTPPLPETLTALAVSDDGRWLAGVDEERLHVWDADTGRELAAWQPHRGRVVGLAAGGGRFFTAGEDQTVQVWPWPMPAERPRVRLTPSEAAILAEALGGENAAVAHEALRKLSADPATVTRARSNLRPIPRPPQNMVHSVRDLVRRLGSEDFDDRQEASRQLAAGDPACLPVLRRELRATEDAEIQARLRLVLRTHERAEEAAEVVSARWLEVLERINTPEAVALVADIAAGDPDHRRTEDALDTLARMTGRKK